MILEDINEEKLPHGNGNREGFADVEPTYNKNCEKDSNSSSSSYYLTAKEIIGKRIRPDINVAFEKLKWQYLVVFKEIPKKSYWKNESELEECGDLFARYHRKKHREAQYKRRRQ